MKGLFIPDITAEMFRNANFVGIATLVLQGTMYDIDYQEPCEDAINRQVIKEQMIKYGFHAPDMTVTEFVEDLLPVTPTRKVGEWIKKNNDYFDWYECSECGYGSDGEMKYNRLCDVRTKFCPDCGSQNLKGE